MRALAVSSPERLPALPDVPTLQARAASTSSCRTGAASSRRRASAASSEKALEDLLVDMTRTPAWQDALKRRGWGDATLAGPEFEQFVAAEQQRTSQVLREIGLG